ncbi:MULTISPECIES: hypothetical protein [Colwellia]|uniref:SnoaL-like domain-containing protein n=1 Tax=Colwellia psychrerythraea (strain 34H / ATCC BAA-681) TaxID=167879 RepID=Q47YI5_COLP3|nr:MULTISPECIES: hypothetical protein [Colwellia]AAZ24083.1 hypothetical protein CPS_3461 [Colwellia psychrerythraea 34H]PKH86891.1 hypothetical protein CXF79_09150 [Colwellia sp. Bg11-28]
MRIDIKLQDLFKRYQSAFIDYDIDEVSRCYHLPCTLNTPDKIILLSSPSDCLQEFGTIFTQLREAKTSDIIAKKASFEQVSEQLYLVCIDWDFIDGQGQVFADFTAIYHVLDSEGALKIVNVISHELDSSLSLTEPLDW